MILARFVFDGRTGGMPLSMMAGAHRPVGALNGEDVTRTDGAFGYRVPLDGQRWFGSWPADVLPATRAGRFRAWVAK
jgi:hypothetical protein